MVGRALQRIAEEEEEEEDEELRKGLRFSCNKGRE